MKIIRWLVAREAEEESKREYHERSDSRPCK